MILYCIYRHPDAELRLKFIDVIKKLNQPEFKVLKWSPEDLDSCDQKSRMLGASLRNGKCLYTELQHKYGDDQYLL